jgi:hypothetical protein
MNAGSVNRTPSRFRSAWIGSLLSCALVTSAALAQDASATVIYNASISGRFTQTWTVHARPGDCVGGGGIQTVTFSSVRGLLVGGSTDTEGADPRANSIDMRFEPFRVSGRLTRTDATTRGGDPVDCASEVVGPHDCGPARPFTIASALLLKGRGLRSARLHLDLTGLDQTFTTKGIIGRAFASTRSCFGPETNEEEGSSGYEVRWPTNDGIARLHHTFTFSGSEPYRTDSQRIVDLPEPGGATERVAIDIVTTMKWRTSLRGKCFRDPSKAGLKCS